ncbi:MAG: hypothetical protein ACE5JX_20965 [Acidobacteriota bacterium]
MESQLVRIAVEKIEQNDDSGQEGFSITVIPWRVQLHKQTGPTSIEWECEQPFSIRFHTPGHFRTTWPFSAGTLCCGERASSGELFPSAQPGAYSYTIEIFPEKDRRIAIDPDYMMEED